MITDYIFSRKEYDELISRENEKILPGNGVLNDTNTPF